MGAGAQRPGDAGNREPGQFAELTKGARKQLEQMNY